MQKNLPFKRTDRVADRVFEMLTALMHLEISNPRLLNVSVTRVRMTDDLKIARIYFYSESMNELAKKNALAGFESAKGFIRGKIAKELQLKFTPDLEFYYDDSLDLFAKLEAVTGSGGK